jgi:hypothetical protein
LFAYRSGVAKRGRDELIDGGDQRGGSVGDNPVVASEFALDGRWMRRGEEEEHPERAEIRQACEHLRFDVCQERFANGALTPKAMAVARPNMMPRAAVERVTSPWCQGGGALPTERSVLPDGCGGRCGELAGRIVGKGCHGTRVDLAENVGVTSVVIGGAEQEVGVPQER